ncbi:FTR1 family iron permease [Actinospongicola halichondriae]|uniref:FTR1 family iron permease n=1 Tax=Actinospongicola halichondriae TaxID=3236844 RepID=UPI003D4C7D2B
MGESFLIALREGFEAALIIAIVLAFVRRSDQPEQRRWVWAGVGAAAALSLGVGLVLHEVIGGLEGVARLRTFAALCLAAAGLLTWMVFWMQRHACGLKGDLEHRAALARGSGWGLAAVAFAAVAREGLETALFLLSTTTTADGGAVALGTVGGLAVAAALGALVHRGSRRFPMQSFFRLTGLLVIVFAAGLLARFVLFEQLAGDLGTVDNAVYDLTGSAWLTLSTQSGRFLAGIFGWDPRPSLEQVVAWAAYALVVTPLFLRPFRRDRKAPVPAA